MEKTGKQTNKQTNEKLKLSALGWFACVWVKQLLLPVKQLQCKFISRAAPSSHSSPLYPPIPTESSLCSAQRARPPLCYGNTRSAEESRYFCKDSTKEWWLPQRLAFVFNEHVTWLISYRVHYTLSSSSKQTKFRRKKGRVAKDGQMSQEALILKRENRDWGKW